MRWPGFLAAFEHPAFRFLWAGAFLSSIGTWVQDVALSWLIHTQTGDAFYLGLRRFAQDVPLLKRKAPAQRKRNAGCSNAARKPGQRIAILRP